MYTAEALSDIHERTHRSLARLLAHCGAFSPDEIDRELAGFGYPTVRLQLNHLVGAEQYWLRVILGRIAAGTTETAESEDERAFPTIAALSAYRERVAAETREYIGAASDAELNTPREMVTWGGRRAVLAPARVLLRTQTHVFQHLGQVAAMCRLLGRPVEAMEFPIA